MRKIVLIVSIALAAFMLASCRNTTTPIKTAKEFAASNHFDSVLLKLSRKDGFQTTSYAVMFGVIFVEGPGMTVFGALGARVGIWNIWIVLLLSILGNFIPDILFYLIGRYAREKFIDKYGLKFGITKERMQNVERLYQDHAFMTLLVVKLVPFLPPAGLAAAGAIRMPIVKYSIYSLIIVLVTSGAFCLIGYYLGEAYLHFAAYQGYALTAIGILIIMVSFAYKRFSVWLGNKLKPKGLD